MKAFQLFFEDGGVDIQIQFFYSAVSSTPEFRRLMRQRKHNLHRLSPLQPEYTVTADSSGQQALIDARDMLNFMQA